MHPVFVELFARPVGWLTIGGALIMFGITIGVPLFIRGRERTDAREKERERGGTP